LYTSNASAALQAEQGLRQLYEFGLYSYCAFVDERQGTCGNHTVGEQFKPYDAITADMFSNYSFLSSTLIPETTFQDSKYLGQSSKAAYWMILFGTICAALALLTFVFSDGLASHSHCFIQQGDSQEQPDIFRLCHLLDRGERAPSDRGKSLDGDDKEVPGHKHCSESTKPSKNWYHSCRREWPVYSLGCLCLPVCLHHSLHAEVSEIHSCS